MKLTTYFKCLFCKKKAPYKKADTSNMNDKTFFTYYLPALKKALEAENIDSGYDLGGANQFYLENKALELDAYEDEIYHDYPILDLAQKYLDYENTLYPNMGFITKENEKKSKAI